MGLEATKGGIENFSLASSSCFGSVDENVYSSGVLVNMGLRMVLRIVHAREVLLLRGGFSGY
jgi:hypothetical protein